MEKQLPHSEEAEESLLGGLLIDPDAYIRVAEIVGPEDFYNEGRRLIFKALGSVERIDHLTIADWLESRNLLEKAGGHYDKCPVVVANAARWTAEILMAEGL